MQTTILDNEYMIAVDVGTTTVELSIINSDGTVIASDYFKNPQSKYGRDIINRINTTNRDKRYIMIMKDMLISEIKESLSNLLYNKHISSESINAMCFCGNTTMISILLEYDLKGLGEYPFNHRLTRSIIKNSKEIFYEDFPLNCKVILSGCASAFIGGDVLSGLIAINKNYNLNTSSNYLFLDLGTNGEMVLYHKGTYYCTSAACGPAFEACTRSNNIYGSNLIDAISLGIKTGKISTDGVLDDNYLDKGIDIMGISINSDILREILLAKAAIRTGIDVLLDSVGVLIDDLDYLFIAGGFGFHLNKENAFFMGLIPHIQGNKLITVGNTSLKGAIEILVNPLYLNFIDKFNCNNLELIQMANLPDYQDKLIKNMNFKQ